MSSKSRSHHGINLDEIERHIREASAAPPSSDGRPEDPLAELARIVGGGPVQRREPRVDPPPSGNSFRSLGQAAAPSVAPPPSTSPVRREPIVNAPVADHARPRSDGPAAQPKPQYSTIEDDIERLLQQAKPSAPPPRRPDELESAMRSLDNLLKSSPPSAPAATPAPVARPASTHASATFSDWSLRIDGGSADVTTAPQTSSPEPTFDFEHELARASGVDSTTRPPSAQNAAPTADPMWQPAPAADYPDEDQYAPPPARRKRPVMMVAAVLGVAALGVGGALSMRGASDRVFSGEPPVISADKGPAKVAPTNPGGLDIPDQNKLVLDRSPNAVKPPTKVVNSEEQPLDLREAVRREINAARAVDASASVASIPAVAPSSPPNAAAPMSPVSVVEPQPDASFGMSEPRRVRTVAIKPPEPGSTRVEATAPMPISAPPPVAAAPAPSPPPASAAAPEPVKPSPPAPTMAAAPPIADTPSPPAPAVASPPPAPKPKVQGSIAASREAARHANAPKPAVRSASEAPDVAAAANTGPLQITPPIRPNARTKPEQRVAAIEPPTPAAVTPPPIAELRSGAPAGGFVVQLTSEGSDQSARTAIGRMQQRFAELGPYSSSVQRREVNGQMRYRVRFGSMPRETATALCATLKSKGQDCILQPN